MWLPTTSSSQALGDRGDTMFFGNDFGTQLDLFISPDNFRRFVLPSFKRLIEVGKKHNKKDHAPFLWLHLQDNTGFDRCRCGCPSSHTGPGQGMSAEELAQYKNDLAFVGGIDAQNFIVNATPEEVGEEVRRVRDIPGAQHSYISKP